MEFYELLNSLIEKHGVQSSDICKGAGLQRPYISKIRNGFFVPSGYQTIINIADAIGLNEEEKIMLSEKYIKAKSPDSLINVQLVFNNFYNLKYPENISDISAENVKLSNGQFLKGRNQIYQAVSAVCSKTEEKLKIFITPFNDCLKKLCEVICRNTKKSVQIEWCTITGNAKNDMPTNMLSFANILSALLIHTASVKSKTEYMEFVSNTNPFPFFVMNENSVLIVNQDADKAVYFDNKDIVLQYNSRYSEFERKSSRYITGYDDAFLFLQQENDICISEKDELYIIKKYPCIVSELNLSMLSEYVSDDLSNSSELVHKYIEFLGNVDSAKKIVNIFPEKMMDSFFSTEEFYECGKQFSKSISKELRNNMLKKKLERKDHVNENNTEDESTDKEKIIFNMLRLPGFENSTLELVNIISNGNMILVYNLGNSYRIFFAQSKTITNSLIDYIDFMINTGILWDDENSKNILISMLNDAGCWEKH